MKQVVRSWGWLPLVAALIILIDQTTKGWVENHLALYGAWAPIPALEPYFKIVHLTNTGAAFGLLQGQGSLFVIIALVVVVGVLVYSRYLPVDSWAVRLCLALQLGGALGNLWDRLQLGHVTDFLLFSLPVGGRVLEWPAFNVADSCIVVGVIGLAIILLRSEGQATEASRSGQEAAAQTTDKSSEA